MKKKKISKIFGFIFVFLLVLAFFFFPLNKYIEKPGGIVDLSTLVKVDQKKDNEKGSFSLTNYTSFRSMLNQ